MTYTCAILEVSDSTFKEIEAKFRAASYDHVFQPDGSIDMTHIAIRRTKPAGGWANIQEKDLFFNEIHKII